MRTPFAVAALVALPAWGSAANESLVRELGGATVDYGAGTISARAGAAADWRLPSAEVARPGAERRARAAAQERLKAALGTLSVRPGDKLTGAAISAALARARATDIEYQSNGGVLLTVVVRFADLAGQPAKGSSEAAPAAATLQVASAPLELAPTLAAGAKQATLGWAVYRLGAPPAGTAAIAVKRDRTGRLVLPKEEATTLEKLAGVGAVIWVARPIR